MTALHLAAQLSSGSVVRALIEGGADVNVQDADQWSPLHYAACFNPAAVPVLLEAKAEVNQLDFIHQSPLFKASFENHREAVVALCGAGADPHIGNSPLTDSTVTDEIKTLIRRNSRLEKEVQVTSRSYPGNFFFE